MRRTRTALTLGAAAVLAVSGLAAAPAQAAPKDPVGLAVAALKAHAGQSFHGGATEYTAQNVLSDPDGSSHVRLHRYQDGLPVLGGDLVVHLDKAGAWKGVDQTLTAPIGLSLTPKVSAASAASTAYAASTASDRSADGAQLVVDAYGASPRLAYAVVVSGMQDDGTPSELHVLVDALGGGVLRSWEAIEQADTGIGHTLHSGDVPLGVTAVSGGYELRDGDRGGHYTIDLKGKKNASGKAKPVTSSTNEFGDGTLNDPATTAADAQYGAAMTWDYYKNMHGRNGIRNDGVGAYSRVHYGRNYVNAFWSDQCFCMTYGDGDASAGWAPLTSLDVAGHEMSHGVTSNTAGLVYNGESGGLNEGTSDIFGTLVEFYAGNSADVGDYLIGEKLRSNGQSLRYMDQPSKDGRSADCWYDGVGSLDVHYSSGVANHFFFLLAVGSGARTVNGVSYNSPTCNNSTVNGLGNDTAGKIWYRALTTHMTSGTNYHDARTATLAAATDLYGAGSAQYNTVNAAWAAVGVS